MTTGLPDAEPSPAASLVRALRTELQRHAPFGQMTEADVDAFILLSRQTYYAPGETLLQPADGAVTRLLWLRRGSVAGGPQGEGGSGERFVVESGELFPVAAWLARRAVSAPYVAVDDCFCLEVPAQAMHELARRIPSLSQFLQGRGEHILALARQAQHAAFASQALAEQSMESSLGSLPRRPLVSCTEQAPLLEVLQLMRARRVGSVLVLDEAGGAAGIFTRHDVLERVALERPAMDTPIARLMSRPVHALDAGQSVHDAVLLMSRHAMRHVPVTEQGRVVAMVSERDLFAMQRLSLRRVGNRLREAASLQDLVAIAPDIRRLAHALMAQGLSARSLTELVSHLNDLLTERAVRLTAQEQGLDLRRACWLAFGSEGRSEQTIATDQDNGLVFASDDPAAERERWLALGRQVNEALAACGYPLCHGGIMAGQPDCCLGVDEWIERFARWIDHGAPEDLLKANIFFDFRPLAGEAALCQPMREFVRQRALQMPRFTRQLAQNALRNAPRLNWRGALDPQREGGHEWIDLKLHGTMIFVDGARLFALAQGVDATGTRARFEAVAAGMRVEPRECQTWIGAFEYLQMLRLRAQSSGTAARDDGNPNRLDLGTLNDLDRRILKESFRAAQRLQQRITLDFVR